MPGPEAPALWLNLELVVYLGTLAVALVLMGLVYVYLVTHQGRANVWGAVEAWCDRHFPWLWSTLRATLSRAGRRRIGILGIVIAFTTLGYVFAELTDSWRDAGRLSYVDQRVYLALTQTSEPAVEEALKQITHLGSLYAASILSAVLLASFWYRRQKRRVVALALVMGVGEALAWALKLVFARKRPEDTLVQAAGDAFPSGHAFTAAALYGFIIYLIWAKTRHPVWRASLTALLAAVAVLVAASRILLRVHWFSDVLGGFTLGLGWLVCCLLMVHVLELPATQPDPKAANGSDGAYEAS